MGNQFERTEKLIGKESVEKLKKSSVLIFGVGGVGSYACEALSRAGVGKIDIVDNDKVDITNINRQIIATHDTIGRAKVDVMRKRMLSINPDIDCEPFELLYLPSEANKFDFKKYDYIIDCIDNVTAKIDIICRAKEAGTPVISSMGTGNKLDPTKFQIVDIEKTSVCPLARVIRKELRARNVKDVNVLFSTEEPVTNPDGKSPASISFVPSVAGLIIAGHVIKELYR